MGFWDQEAPKKKQVVLINSTRLDDLLKDSPGLAEIIHPHVAWDSAISAIERADIVILDACPHVSSQDYSPAFLVGYAVRARKTVIIFNPDGVPVHPWLSGVAATLSDVQQIKKLLGTYV